MLLFTVGCGLGLLLVGVGEWLRQQKLIGNEAARKIVHLAHALTVAGWAFFIPYWLIALAEVMFIIAVLVAHKYRIFAPLSRVKRSSWGEYFFPAGVIILALLQPPAWMFFAAMLHLGMADALAALVGKRVGRGRYIVFDHIKTVAGSVTFFGSSLTIIYFVYQLSDVGFSHHQLGLSLVIIPIVSTLVENLSPLGSDNLTIPLFVVGMLQLISLRV